MEDFTLAFHTVAPMFLLVGLGCAVRRVGIVSRRTALECNALCFKVFLSTLLFYNVYRSDLSRDLDGGLVGFCLAGVLLEFLLGMAAVPRLESSRPACGVMVQACFRANTVLLGLPVCTALFGEPGAAAASLLLAVVVPVLNVLAVLTLEFFRGSSLNWGRALRGVGSNPLVLGSLLGILFSLTGLRLPETVEAVVSDLAAAATPLSLLFMGAALDFSRLRSSARNLLLCTAFRLVLAPAAALGAAAALGFRGIPLCAVFTVFAVPVAVNSYTMALQMDGDADLAGGIVLLSSAGSCVTLFLWIWLLRSLGWF